MGVANRTTVVGVFPTAAQADKAVDAYAGDRGSEAEMILNQCGRSRNDRFNAPHLESTRT